ncbi:MAG: hypothetical protein ACRD2J_12335 [Thermoanaerobaculia bacterium]
MQPETNEPIAGTDDGASGSERALVRRIVRFAGAGWLVAGAIYAVRADWMGLLGLTCSGAVAMINFLWLEEVVSNVLRPTLRVQAWRLGVRALARFALFGVAIAISIFVVRFNPLSVLFGFSILVVGIGCEVLYSVYRAFREGS